MAVYTIHDVETGEATNYDRERVTEKLRSLITVKDMTDNIHWKNRTVFAGTDKSVFNVFNICVDYFIEWILATVPSNTLPFISRFKFSDNVFPYPSQLEPLVFLCSA